MPGKRKRSRQSAFHSPGEGQAKSCNVSKPKLIAGALAFGYIRSQPA